ncbi:unnamed protein product [Hymenolepis diminuta]|uniref:Ufm1-specific protease 1 n=1 Tax=Hymenolepis diminuta TaxID=6216 RepID=A0A0R3SQN6_HYMDI|nr:unnamed protein product [Hymenolepis diminuta]
MLKISSQDCLREVDKDRESVCTFKGICEYWHYGAQNTDDRGWGCGYRTLQTIISWFKLNLSLQSTFPDLEDIQSILVSANIVPKSYLKSTNWIGSVEVGAVIHHLTHTDYRIIQVQNGKFTGEHLDHIRKHFELEGAPIMMGGSQDNSSKCILALKEGLDSKSASLLILDPHYYGVSGEKEPNLEFLWKEGWLKWCKTDSLMETDFYNMCMPMAAYK